MCTTRCAHQGGPDLTSSHELIHLVRWCVLGGRYSRAISSINDLLTEWDSMSYVQKASPVEVGRLILGGEAIINDERLAWQKTGIRNKDSGVEGPGEEKVQKESGRRSGSVSRGAELL